MALKQKNNGCKKVVWWMGMLPYGMQSWRHGLLRHLRCIARKVPDIYGVERLF
jgi:hypothetical protein